MTPGTGVNIYVQNSNKTFLANSVANVSTKTSQILVHSINFFFINANGSLHKKSDAKNVLLDKNFDIQ